MGRLVSAVILFYALEKLAVLLAVPLLLGAAWLKYKVHRMDGDKWDRYFRAMPNGKYAALFFAFYTQFSSILSADGNIESLIALFS